MPKYADFINEQNSPEEQKKYTGWVGDPNTGQGTAVDKQHNMYKLQQKPMESQFEMGENEIATTGFQQPSYVNPNQDVDIDSIVDKEFNIGKMAIENEYQMENHKAIQTSTNTAQVDVFLQNAKMIHDMKMNELMANYQRTKLMFKKYQQDSTLDTKDAFLAKSEFHKSNPVYKISKTELKPEKPVFTIAQQQRGLGKILKDTAGINDKEMMMDMAAETFGPDFDETAPGVYKYINELPETQGQEPQGKPTKKLTFLEDLAKQNNEKGYSSELVNKAIQDYNGLGGHQTEQGQKYKKKVLSQFDQPQQQTSQQIPHQSLTPYWPDLTDEEKQTISLALKQNPNNIKIILQRLKGNK